MAGLRIVKCSDRLYRCARQRNRLRLSIIRMRAIAGATPADSDGAGQRDNG